MRAATAIESEAIEPEHSPRSASACVLLSGGMDSAVCLYWALERYERSRVFALAVNYGQRHRRELTSARQIAADVGVELVVRTIAIPWRSSQLTGQRLDADSPVVPGRNPILATLAAAEVTARGGDTVVMGCCADDALGFADCRPTFVVAAGAMLTAAFDRPVHFRAPFVTFTKAQLLREAERLGALAAVGASWSCYRPQSAGARGPVPCRACHACEARAAAFDALDLVDPGRR